MFATIEHEIIFQFMFCSIIPIMRNDRIKKNIHLAYYIYNGHLEKNEKEQPWLPFDTPCI